MKYSIGVDIGGTKIAIALVSEKGDIINDIVLPTNLHHQPEKMMQVIIRSISDLIDQNNLKQDIIGIGVGAPGPLNANEGRLINPPNLPTWNNFHVKKPLEDYFGFEVMIENDANVAALGEKWIGAGKELNNFVYMTISTGIGVGIINDNRLLRGSNGNAGEFGHTVIDPSFEKCPRCGQKGCVESIASGTAIANYASRIMKKELTTQEVFHLYEENNNDIKEYLEKVFSVLGSACVTLINMFDPETIVIGGGVSQAGNTLIDPIRSYVKKHTLNIESRNIKIVTANLSKNTGVIGAASLFFEPN